MYIKCNRMLKYKVIDESGLEVQALYGMHPAVYNSLKDMI
jgi:hypothetical protein